MASVKVTVDGASMDLKTGKEGKKKERKIWENWYYWTKQTPWILSLVGGVVLSLVVPIGIKKVMKLKMVIA